MATQLLRTETQKQVCDDIKTARHIPNEWFEEIKMFYESDTNMYRNLLFKHP
jgi:hypothetical protein